jgi:hypothetical protein
VRELGFANLAIGAVGALSIVASGRMFAGALAGGIFYGLAGMGHAVRGRRATVEDVAMTSDLFVAAVLLGLCALAVIR